MADRDLVGKLAAELAGSPDVARRREAATRLRDVGFAARTSLEKRGSLHSSAKPKLDDEHLELLERAMSDRDVEVRVAAITTAGDLGDARLVDRLLEAVAAPQEDVQLAAIDAMGDIGGARCLDALTTLACDDDREDELRLAAITELEELAAKGITSGPDRRWDPDAVAEPPDLAALDPDAREARERLGEALAAIRADDDADELLRVKASDIQTYLDRPA